LRKFPTFIDKTEKNGDLLQWGMEIF